MSKEKIYIFDTTLRAVSYTHLRAHETLRYLVCRLLLEKKKGFNKACRLIGLFNETNEKRAEYKKSKVKISEDYILSKIKVREDAKKEGNYKLADQIRDNLNNEGVDIKDEKGKTTWSYK